MAWIRWFLPAKQQFGAPLPHVVGGSFAESMVDMADRSGQILFVAGPEAAQKHRRRSRRLQFPQLFRFVGEHRRSPNETCR